MLLVLSPAKKLDFDTPVRTTLSSEPVFAPSANELIAVLQGLSAPQLQQLMKLSPALAELNVERYRTWHDKPGLEYARQAALAFNGDVYEGLQAHSLSDTQLQWAQGHVAILSGLYGVLRPLDLIQPHRLEMGTRLSTGQGSNLYQYWGDRIAAELNQRLDALSGPRQLLNLASNEYFKAVDLQTIDAELCECVFRDYKNGSYKVISFYAKRARGMMARYIIDNSIDNIADLQGFALAGYKYNASASDPKSLVFERQQEA